MEKLDGRADGLKLEREREIKEFDRQTKETRRIPAQRPAARTEALTLVRGRSGGVQKRSGPLL